MKTSLSISNIRYNLRALSVLVSDEPMMYFRVKIKKEDGIKKMYSI